MHGNDYRDEDVDDYLADHGLLWAHFRVYFDVDDLKWRCRCAAYLAEGKCPHLVRYMPTETVRVSDQFL